MAKTNYIIRQVQEHDLSQLLHLMEAHAALEKTRFSQEGKLPGLHRALFESPQRLYGEVVVGDDALVGYCTYTYDFSTWAAAEYLYLDCLFLAEQVRNAGIGGQLMRLLRQKALERGCVNLQWQTPVFNTSAIRFYQTLGATSTEKARFVWTL